VGRLRKILELELKRGADDGAVIGGLDQFLRTARQDNAVDALIDAAPNLPEGYAAASEAARRQWLQLMLTMKAPSPGKTAAAKPGDPKQAKKAAEKPKPMVAKVVPGAGPLDQPVTLIKGVKAAMQSRLAKIGVRTVRDLIYLFPNRHNNFADVQPIADLKVDEEQTVMVSVWSTSVSRFGKTPRGNTQAIVGDETGTMRVVWFNQPYMADQLKTNDKIVLAGKVGLYNRQKTMENPEWERVADDLTHTGRLVPIYPLTQGLSQRVLRRAVKEAVDAYAVAVEETLPDDVRKRHGLAGLQSALRQVHYPDSPEKYEQARRRLAFEELLCVQLAVMERRLAWEKGRAAVFKVNGVLDDYVASLPFALTGAQQRVMGEIVADLESSRPMARLLQGDVGSGKTAVAAAALVIAVANGYQGALMAPTEILAEQHFRTLSRLLSKFEVDGRLLRVELLVGSQTAATKRRLAEAVASGEIDVIVGTHALIQDAVNFKRLGVAVVDEQHRFGVMQRQALRDRAISGDTETPHLLVMSATPIPRTLARTCFGDLDVAEIDEMPPGRKPIETTWIAPDRRSSAYGFVREEIKKGRQAFVVCPLIDESEAIQSRSATQEYERLSREIFPELRLGLLHGRMSSADKDLVLAAFRDHRLDILVATTVIEVGIDIPNASVMVIEGADRFGLAQMHQLRGRVGRGAEQSYCLLLSDDPSWQAQERLKLLETLDDGFKLAEADLQLRGSGDLFGTRQSGLPEMRAAELSDSDLIEKARQEAIMPLRADPELSRPEHTPLAKAVLRAKQASIGEAH
jgi:ATP-dependent DNA helicase RecG